MCYFDCTRWRCGYWKWGNFREQCNKEYRTGETCGMKLVYGTDYLETCCKTCDQINTKTRRLHKMHDDVARWRNEGNRRATIEKTQKDMREIQGQIDELWYAHQTRVHACNY